MVVTIPAWQRREGNTLALKRCHSHSERINPPGAYFIDRDPSNLSRGRERFLGTGGAQGRHLHESLFGYDSFKAGTDYLIPDLIHLR